MKLKYPRLDSLQKALLEEELADTLNITDLVLPSSFWNYARRCNLLNYNEPAQSYEWTAAVTLPLLILKKAEFYFPEDFDFYSNAHPDCLAAPLMRALAAAEVQGRPYTFDTGEPLTLPVWAYSSPKQITLNLEN